MRARAPVVDAAIVAAVNERERTTDHDVAAFVDVIQDRIGPPAGKWVHYGLTSSDVVDTAGCAQLTRAADLLIDASTRLIESLRRRAEEFRDDARWSGRTHGVHAEPTTFGAKLALWACRPTATVTGCWRPAGRWRSASCRARSAPTPTSTRRSRPTCAGRSG